MAKTTVTTATLPIVDLIRSKPKLKYLDIPKYRADVVISVTTSGMLTAPKPVPSTAMDRLKSAADKVMLDYEKIITEEAIRLDGKIDALMKQPTKKNLALAEQMLRDANMSIKNALASAEPAAQKAVEKRLKEEGQKDKLLKEARVKTAVKVTVGVIKIASSVAVLVASHGAEVTSYKTIVMEVYKLGMEVKQQLKDEAKLRKDLEAALKAFLKLRESALQQALAREGLDDLGSKIDFKAPLEALSKLGKSIKAAGTEVTKGKDPKAILGSIVDFAVKKIKSGLADIEKARKFYREHTTKTMHRADALGAAADKLMKAMRANKTLKEGVKIGAECMNLKRQGALLNKKLAEREAFLAEIQAVMEGNGLKIDDRTTLQKIAELDKSTLMEEGKGLMDIITTVKDLVENVADAVA
ncbi:hypothetical protein [Phaeovulum sp. W22_SRMD_FR3]|uniref:hypothetical protein n=1 Tax=Phaeovulum sp. W22_SRMD_FR3 TaxID=3240274 RepID=UPI003F9AE009